MRYSLSLLWLLPSLTSGAAFYEKSPQGFLWYQELAPSPIETRNQINPPKLNEGPLQEAKARNTKIKKDFNEAVEIFLDNPTIPNALHALKLQKMIFDRGEKAADAWILASLLHPELMDLGSNPNLMHRDIQKKEKEKEIIYDLKMIAQDWGLILQWEKGCPYCEKFHPIVGEIQKAHSFQVLAVSTSGEKLAPFESQKDKGFLQAINPKKEVPVLYLVHKSGKYIYVVAHGLTERKTIEENIHLVARNHGAPPERSVS